jgi:phage shock protein PspC (stress-responsive transcriptional regulator)
MNRTLNINIAGSVFHIDEQAYEPLSKYLSDLRRHFNGAAGQDEIIQDIEARIAELFRSRMGTVREVVSMEDVEHVMAAMGRPENFADESEEATDPTTESQSDPADRGPKRLFRDPDDKVIGGVCSGISHYLGMGDPVWLRLALALMVIFGGTGVLLYIILWAIIPKAKTTAEKLQMRGENVTVSNIEKRINEEFTDIKDKLGNGPGVRKAGDVVQKLLSLMVSLITMVIKFAGAVLGFLLLMGGILWFMGVLVSVFFMPDFISLDHNGVVSRVMINDLLGQLFPSHLHANIFRVGTMLAWGIPALVVSFFGTRLMLGYKLRNRYVILPALGLWIVGIGMQIYGGTKAYGNFKETHTDRADVPLDNIKRGKTLYLDLDIDTTGMKGHEFNELFFDLLISEDGTSFHGKPQLNVVKSPDSLAHIVIKRFSRGADRKQAAELAGALNYNFSVSDSLVRFSPWFEFPEGDQWRAQKLWVEVQVPAGVTVHLSEDLERIIYDIQNVNSTYDGDMGGRRWMMQSYGLECVDCDGLKRPRHRSSSDWDTDEEDSDTESMSEDIDDARDAERAIEKVQQKMERVREEIEEDRLRMEEKMRQKEEELRQMEEKMREEKDRIRSAKGKEEADASGHRRILLKRQVRMSFPIDSNLSESVTFTVHPLQS